MIDYGVRILWLSAVISIITAVLAVLGGAGVSGRPIKGVVVGIYAAPMPAAPEDARGIIHPSAGVTELREAEEALQTAANTN